MPEIIIRQLEKKDAVEVALLIPLLTGNIVEPENLPKRIAGLVNPGNWQYFVVELCGKVIGFGGLAWYEIPSKGPIGWIEEFVVSKEWWGCKIGERLLDELLKLAVEKSLQQVKLTTGNNSAIHLYKKAGFTIKPEDLMIKKYY